MLFSGDLVCECARYCGTLSSHSSSKQEVMLHGTMLSSNRQLQGRRRQAGSSLHSLPNAQKTKAKWPDYQVANQTVTTTCKHRQPAYSRANLRPKNLRQAARL